MTTPQALQKLRPYIPLIVFVLVIAGLLVHYQTLRPTPVKTSVRGLDTQIEKLEAQAEKQPLQTKVVTALSEAYLQKVRETADVSYYAKIDALLDAIANVVPEGPDIAAARSAVAAGRHQFKEAEKFAAEALALNPHRVASYGLLADAQIELGKYDDAETTLQKMLDLRPSLSALSRVAYLRELMGDISGAKEALIMGISAGSTYPENTAWAWVELAKLQARDDRAEAAAALSQALTLIPNYPPALEGKGQLAYAQGDAISSLAYFMQAYKELPIAQYAMNIGDLAALTGNATTTAQYYTLAQIAFARSVASGTIVDLEEANFLSDRDRDLPHALKKARAAYRERPSVHAADALAWALLKNGKVAEAQVAIKDALRLGEHEPLIIYHAGMIARAAQNMNETKRLLTKALTLHPHFSLLGAAQAREALQTLK